MKNSRQSRNPRPLSVSLGRLSSSFAVAAALSLATGADSHAVNNTWNAASGTDFSWDTITNWSLGAEPIATDDVIFPTPIPNPGALANPQIITLTAGEVANSLTFDDSYTLTGGDITLTAGDVTVASGVSATFGSVLLGNTLVSKEGAGLLTLNTASARTGATAVNEGTLIVGNVGALGTGDITVAAGASLLNAHNAAAQNFPANVILDGGSLIHSPAGNQQLNFAAGKSISIGVAGGLVEVSPGAGSASKILLGAGQLAGSGALTKTGAGVIQLSGANTGFSGTVAIDFGTVEFQNADSLGTVATTITVNGGGDITTSNASNRNNITLNAGGIISANNAAANYTGTVNVAGDATAALRTFQAVGTASSFTISGPLTGTGTLSATAPGAATLTLSGNNSAYSGAISAGTNATVLIANAQALGTGGFALNGGTVRINAGNVTGFTAGVQGLNATYYNFGANAGGTVRADNRYASELLALDNGRIATGLVDPNINIPNSAQGYQPIAWRPGFHVTAANTQEGAAWSGAITITAAGSYTFTSGSDDGSLLYIDGVQVVNNDGGHGAPGPTPTGTITLSAGQHSIFLKGGNGTGGGAVQLSYNGPDTGATTVLVPSSVLSTATATGSLAIGPVSLPDAGVATTSTLDIQANSEASTLALGTNQTFLLVSPTISTLTVTGATTLTGAGTLTPASGKLVLNGAIGESFGGTGLTIGVPAGNGLGATAGNGYIVQFNSPSTYTGTTTVTGSQLQLNASSDAISGNLTVNAANLGGPIKNVILQQSNQIADISLVSVQNGILDLGANSDTIDTLTMSGGRIMGSGTLTPTTAITLTGGQIDARIGGSLGLTLGGTGTVTLAGNNTYTGQTIINTGALRIANNNALGAVGGGNDTIVNAGGQLQIQGGITTSEVISIAGDGGGSGAIKNLAGSNSIVPSLTLTGASTIQSDSGNLDLVGGLSTGGAALTVRGSGETTITGAIVGAGAGSITKTGNGTLTFNQNVNAGTLGLVTHSAGILGFTGAQSIGASALASGLGYRFNGDPGAGVDVTAAANSAVIAGQAATQALLTRINTASAGAYALGVNSGNNLDFSSHATLGLGAYGLATYSGTITPNAAGYRFSGAPVTGNTPNILRLANALTGTNAVTINGGTLDLSGVASTFAGNVNINGGTIRVLNNTDLGAAANVINLNGGTLAYDFTNHNTGHPVWAELGNVLGGGQRTINVGAAGGTLAVTAFQSGGNLLALSGVNPLTGSGTLTKSGFGHAMLMDSTSFSGPLVIAAQSANFEMRSRGALPNVASVEVNQSSNFVVDNFNAWGPRQFSNPTNDQARVNDAATITLKGGALFYRSRNVAAQISETFGTVAAPEGQNLIRIEKNGTVGGEIIITNLTRPVGGGTVRFEKNAGTFGTAGDNSRIFLTNVNGAAPGVVNLLGGWAYNTSDFQWVGYGANGIVNSTNTAQGAAAFTPVAANVYDLNAAGTATLADAAGNVHSMAALRFGNNAAQTLAFTDGANDVLFIGSGGILNDNSNQTRAIGTSAQRGKITAGISGAPAGAKELFFHLNQNTTTVESSIIDNNGPVTLVKDLGATLQLATANPYSGGTNIFAGRINAFVAGSLGSGPVLVKGGALELRAPGTTTSATAVITGRDGSEIYLQNGTAIYTTAGDRFVIEGGSGLTGNSNNAGQNLASLTRIDVGAPFTAGGQVKLHPNAVIRSTSPFNGDIMTNMVANLGTNADLYFNQSGGGGMNQFINIGQGTPWKGLSSSVGNSGWNQGTINAYSDFWLQGLTRVASNVVLTMGGIGTGSYAINNLAGAPINAFVEGQVTLNEDSPVVMPGNLTFVVTPGGYLQPNYSNSFGSQAGNLNARVVIQAGGTVDPGNFVTVGVAGNQPQGIAYPAPSPLNTNVVAEAGGRLLVNDASGIGSTTGGATFTMKANSVLELGNSQAFLGSDAGGLIHAGQFVFEPGTIVRSTADRIFMQDVFSNAEPNGNRTVLEIWGGNRNLTDAVDPRVVIAPGSATVTLQNYTFGNGGMITNDSNDRTINERRGGITLEDGAILAATSQTTFNIQESVTVPAGATVYVGSSKYVDGNPKTGLVQFTGTASNVFGAGAKLVVQDGSAFSFAGTHTFDDTAAIELPAAVTAFPSPGAIGFNPGTGSTLLLNVNNYVEIMGSLTGNGAVIGNQGTSVFAPGYGMASDFTFAGVVKSANGQNPHMIKVGATKMTLTNVSDTAGSLAVMQGEVSLAGANGKWRGGELRLGKGGILTFDNTVNAVVDRQEAGGTGNRWLTTLGGGEFRLLGHATDVADVTLFGLANAAGGNISYGGNVGGFGKVTVVPNGDLSTLRTSLTIGTIERFDNTGERNAAWLLRGVGMAGLPGTYDSAGVYTPNAGNPKDGLIFITDPNFTAGNAYDASGNASGIIFGGPGTPVAPVSGLLLGSANPTATEGDFLTIDIATGAARTGARVLQSSEYTTSLALTGDLTTGLNVRATGALNATGNTRFQVIKLENGSSLNVAGTLPALTQPGQVLLSGGGILVPSGATANLSASDNGAGADSVIRTVGGISAYVHSFGNLNVTGEFFSDVGLVKTGSGTATFGTGSLSNLRGRIALHEGTLSINDSLANVRNSGVNAVAFNFPHLELTGGTLNLNGKSQGFGRLESGNFLAGAATEGGTITSVAPATITVNDAGGFNGHITGAISYHKVGNNTHILHNTNTYTGTTTVRQGTLLLRADATLANTTQVDLNYARIDIDDGHLAYVPNRINTAATVNFRSADFVNRGRAGTLTQQSLGTVNLLQGHNLFQTLAGGGGATETIIGNLVRSAGATVSFQQNYGFVGTAGNDTTAIRYLPALINGVAPALTNDILPAWMIVNNDHFATYQAGKGISYLSNTEDGFATYGSGDLSTATALQNVNDGTGRTIAASKTVNAIRHAPGAAQTNTLNAGVVLTIGSGGLLTNANQAITYASGGAGAALTSGGGELYTFIQQNTTSLNLPITGGIALVKAGSGTLALGGANTYSGITYVGQGSAGNGAPSGALNAGVTGANGTTIVAIPGDLQIHHSTVNVTVANSIANASNVTLNGGAILNMRDADATTETLNSLTFANVGGDANNRAIVSRAAARPTSFLALTGATAISANNDNPFSTPTISVNIGTMNYTRGAGLAQTLQLDSPVGVNGLAAAALVHNANIGTVPTGVAEGGLIKAGTGLLILGGTGTTQFGNPGVATDVFNIQSGVVRVDQVGALGPVTAVTTVQNGAVLLLNNAGSTTGSVRLKDGSFLGITLNSSILGAVASTGTLEVPAAATTTVGVFDYFVPSTNTGNVIVNHQLIGSGTINLTGIEYATGYNGGGLFQLRNEANSFSGAINIGTNAVLEANTNAADLTGNTFGTATLNLDGGVLRVRDAGNNAAGVQTVAYGNNVNLNADSLIDVDRLGSAANQKTIAFGTLNVAAGTRTLSTPYGTGASITPNDYRVAFAQVDGAGTLVKGGSRYVDINGYAGGFSGNIVVAGPKGLNLPTSGNLTLNAAANTISNLTVGGFHSFVAGKAVTITSMLDVTDNAGEVANGLGGVNTGEIVGAVTLTNTAAVTAAVVRNNGLIAANNSVSTLTAPSIRGSGLYQAYGQDLTLDGALADDGANPTTLKVAGSSTSTAVILTSTGSANTGGADVQSGILRLAPTGGTATNPLGSGTIRVHGAPASALGAGSQPIAAQNAKLEFAGATISQAGNITNTGTVRTSSGTTTLTGVIQGTAAVSSSLTDFLAGTVPGLLEGRFTTTAGLPDTDANGRLLTAARLANPGNFGVKLEPRMGQTAVVTQNGLTGWSDNTAWIYTGYFYDADGVFTFMENVDDSTLVSIDGVTRLSTGGDRITSTATQKGQRGSTLDTGTPNTAALGDLITAATPLANNPNLPAGWHTIEIRFDNGGGGAGPWGATNGFGNNYGFGLNPDGTMTLDGTQALRPIDPGDGTLFRTAAAGKGSIEVEGGSTLNVAGFTQTALVEVGTEGTPSNLNITGTGVSVTDSLIIGAGSTVTLAASPAPSEVLGDLFAGGDAGAGFEGAAFVTGGEQSGVAVVPEPGSVALLAFGALGLLGRRRRS